MSSIQKDLYINVTLLILMSWCGSQSTHEVTFKSYVQASHETKVNYTFRIVSNTQGVCTYKYANIPKSRNIRNVFNWENFRDRAPAWTCECAWGVTRRVRSYTRRQEECINWLLNGCTHRPIFLLLCCFLAASYEKGNNTTVRPSAKNFTETSFD